MQHLGVDKVRKQFKGMVERCDDCGFDLAGGLVEVVPTAHYMMGGIVFQADCRTELEGLFTAGEDTGGVHGANRLGGNGVANSTVFGGIAGDSMAAWLRGNGILRAPDETVIEAAVQRSLAPFSLPAAGLESIREALYECMWEDVGIMRDAQGLLRARQTLADLAGRLAGTGIAGGDRCFNPTWHDWLNLQSLISVSQVITEAALAREDSRGAHFREDFPATGDLATSAYTVVRQVDGSTRISHEPVQFTRIAPGQTLLQDAA
jgi:fumarate reductase flavoprotein subunit